jgi:uncharacterized repeat protein (TIGR01451 family)
VSTLLPRSPVSTAIFLGAALVACGGSGPSAVSRMQVQDLPVVSGSGGLYFPKLAANFATEPHTLWFQVTNQGPDDARNVRLVNTLTSGVRLVDVTCSVPDGSAAKCPAAGSDSSVLASMPAQSKLNFGIKSMPARIETIVYQATLTALADTDASPANNSWASQSRFSANELQVRLTAPATASAGARMLLLATVFNAGSSEIDEDSGLNLIPSALFGQTLQPISCRLPDGDECPSRWLSRNYTARPGATLLLSYAVDVPADARGAFATTLDLGRRGDSDPTNNVATSAFTVTAPSQ